EQFDEWSPLFLGGTLYTFVGNYLRGHDVATGQVISTVLVTSNNGSNGEMLTAPVSDGSNIYIVSRPNLYAFRPGEPTPMWTVAGFYAGMPAVANSVVYALFDGQLRAHDAATGALLWMFPADGYLAFPPVVVGHWVFVASPSNVYAVDINTQTLSWSSSPGGWIS